MDLVQAKIDILNWITGFVEKPTPALNGWPPCPYARKARLAGLVDIRTGTTDPIADLANISLGDYEVVAYYYDPMDFSAEEFEQLVQQLNDDFLSPKGLFALADHPKAVETVNGVVMNQGTYALIFLQSIDKLNHFAQLLGKQGYYDGWPESYLRELFAGRDDPRP